MSALDATLKETAGQIFGKALDKDQWVQAQLPGALAGCGLRLPSATRHAACWASWAMHEQQARQLSASLGRVADHDRADDCAHKTEEELLALGVQVRLDRAPQLTQPAQTRFDAGPWSKEAARTSRPGESRRYMGSVLQLLEGLQATALWESKPHLSHTEMLASGGS